jgi:hypothetical protein
VRTDLPQGEECEDFNIPVLINLVLKCYEVARAIQSSASLQVATAKPNSAAKPSCQADSGGSIMEGIKVPTPWASGNVGMLLDVVKIHLKFGHTSLEHLIL